MTTIQGGQFNNRDGISGETLLCLDSSEFALFGSPNPSSSFIQMLDGTQPTGDSYQLATTLPLLYWLATTKLEIANGIGD